MSSIFKTEQRRVIPRFRSFEIASSTGELMNYLPQSDNTRAFQIEKSFEGQLTDWKINKSLINAGDILSSAYVLGLETDFHEIASFIVDHSAKHSSLTRMAEKILTGQERTLTGVESSQIGPIDRNFEIRVLKRNLIKEPKNPIAWMELGRLYALKGQVDKANRAVENALILDRNNRFIARSASRFYHHFTDTEKALHTIRNAEFYKHDPWLLSAEISYSQILNRFSRMIKQGAEVVKQNSASASSLTELTSALGTFEFTEGNTKAAKKYFKQALIVPNDNSLAQVNWVAENMHGFDVDTLSYQLPLAFEAKSIYYSEKGLFNEAYDEAIKWHEDEPFSVRPIKVASYIQAFYFKDFKKSAELTERGLIADPTDIMLNNNLIYYQVRQGEMESAFKRFDGQLKKVVQNPQQFSVSEQIFCFATTGLIFYKQNMPELGEEYYLKAINLAKKDKNYYLRALATINYTREALNVADDFKREELFKNLYETCKNNEEQDVKYMLNELLQTRNSESKN